MPVMSSCRPGPIALAALAATVLAACGPASTSTAPGSTTGASGSTTTTAPAVTTTTTTPTTTTTTTTARPAAPLSGKALVTAVVLTRQDLTPGFKLRLYEQGDRVRGQVSLDFCGYRYTTEPHRAARRQVAVTDAAGKLTGSSNEVLAYDTAARAAKALEEYRAAVRGCPADHAVASPVAGAPLLRYRYTSLGSDAGLPVAQNTVVMATVFPKGGGRLYFRVVLQRRGRVLDLHYLVSDTTPTRADQAGLLRLAAATGSRLAALPEGAVS